MSEDGRKKDEGEKSDPEGFRDGSPKKKGGDQLFSFALTQRLATDWWMRLSNKAGVSTQSSVLTNKTRCWNT